MTILARFQNIDVEVLNSWTSSRGKVALVQALSGQPFKSWTHGGWAESDSTTVLADTLKDVRTDPQAETKPNKPNLLTLALQHTDKKQWYAGEVVHLWKNGKRRAFLKEQHGFIHLCLTGEMASCCIFWLDPVTWSWEVSNNIESDYPNWVRKVRSKNA